jgi:asparagine synthase (glutamine-hydrolysing)
VCGIAGILEGHEALRLSPDVLDRMCDSLAHRGPDDRGTLVSGPAHLGHRRLSIIDIDGGHQPMALREGGPVVIYNGEIYNFHELRRELEGLGHVFATRCDTEVLLHAWAQWGLDAPAKLRGMFAFAMWEPEIGRLVLVRDRLGIKPVHWARARGAVVFGSELKAVVKSGLVADELDPQAIDDFFANGYIRTPMTIFAGAHKLAPGHMLVVQRDAASGRLRIDERSWWQLPRWDARARIGYAEAKEELAKLLDDAVRVRLVADVPLGAFLSGGLDSSTVVSIMARHVDRPIETFSIGFDDAEYDETVHARAIAKHFRTNHREEIVRADSVALLPALMAAHDEPFGDPSAIPTWYVSQMARRHVTVALSGDGGDELFAGYTRYAHLGRELERRKWLPTAARRLLALGGRVMAPESRRRGLVERLAMDPEQHYARFRANFPEPMRRALFTPEFADRTDMAATARVFAGVPASFETADPVTRLQAADLHWYLPDDILTKVDRMSMAHSLEARVPLLDHHVVEFVTGLPVSFKLEPHATKAILREIVTPALPPAILQRGKRGFSVPLSRWLAGPLRPLMEDTVHSGTFARSGRFEPAYVQRLWDLHRSGARDMSWALWQLLVFREWNEGTRPALFG